MTICSITKKAAHAQCNQKRTTVSFPHNHIKRESLLTSLKNFAKFS